MEVLFLDNCLDLKHSLIKKCSPLKSLKLRTNLRDMSSGALTLFTLLLYGCHKLE